MDPLIPNPALYDVPYEVGDFNGMPCRPLGVSGLRVGRIGLGTWKFGMPETGDKSRVDPQTALRIFDRAIELGVTFWDTANRYNLASGNAERIIGQWFRNNPDERRNVVLATKVYGGMDGVSPNHSRLSRTNILEALYASLRRLQVDYVDVLYFHRFDAVTPVEESLAAIEDLVRRDLVRYFAVSNFTVDQLKLYRAAEREFGPRLRILAVQNRFDIVKGENPKHEGVLDFCARTGVSFVPYSPLARGLLTERYLEPAKVGEGDRLFDEGTLHRDLTSDIHAKMRALSELAHEAELELSQLVLAYTLTLPGMGPLIPSSSSVAQLQSNAAAGKVELSEEQKVKVREILVGPGGV